MTQERFAQRLEDLLDIALRDGLDPDAALAVVEDRLAKWREQLEG